MLEPSRQEGALIFELPTRTLVVAAHPDDETIGAGGALQARGDCWVLHLTDGAPHDRRCWPALARGTREEYARVRRRELSAALDLAGIPRSRRLSFEVADQEATGLLVPIAWQLRELLLELQPAAVLTHPYEGGHPDHDAAAFAVHAAYGLLQRQRMPVPLLLEMTSYHRSEGGLATGAFLPQRAREVSLALDPDRRERKRAMLDCFVSQREVLAPFGVERERFRAAPDYDFTQPPHPLPLHYELLGWPHDFRTWRARAREALRELGLGGEACR